MKFFSYSDPDAALTADSKAQGVRPLLREFSDDELDSLHPFVAQLRFARGSPILAVGERHETLLIIVSGSVRLTAGAPAQGGEREIDCLGEGEVFGIAAFLDGEASALAATALEATELLALRRASFAQLAAWKPALAIALLQDLGAYASRRLRELGVAC